MLLSWTVLFFIIAIIAGVFGFFALAETAAWIAKILFFIFLVLFFISLFVPTWRRPWGEPRV